MGAAVSEGDDYRADGSDRVRVLFCFGVQPAFFELPSAQIDEVIATITRAFDDLSGRFGLTVLGTMDDDELMVGPSSAFPWTAYVLADAPDHVAVAGVCAILRDTSAGDGRLWRYMRVEARVGRPLFFGRA